VNVGRGRRRHAGPWTVAILTVAVVVGALAPAARAHGGSGGPYRYVRPPAEAVATNQPPAGRSGQLLLGPSGRGATSFWTPDLQAVVVLPEGATGARPEGTSVSFSLEPVDPVRLPPLPPLLRADGNAHVLRLRVDGSGLDLGPLALPGRLLLAVPVLPVAGVLRREGDRPWVVLPARSAPDGGVEIDLDRAGTYLAVRRAPPADGWTWAGVGRRALPGLGLALLITLLLRARRRRRAGVASRGEGPS
jgi:hypothetical protein